jgi:hypothetical protein
MRSAVHESACTWTRALSRTALDIVSLACGPRAALGDADSETH